MFISHISGAYIRLPAFPSASRRTYLSRSAAYSPARFPSSSPVLSSFHIPSLLQSLASLATLPSALPLLLPSRTYPPFLVPSSSSLPPLPSRPSSLTFLLSYASFSPPCPLPVHPICTPPSHSLPSLHFIPDRLLPFLHHPAPFLHLMPICSYHLRGESQPRGVAEVTRVIATRAEVR
ncbi:hypothetical protein C8J57DRAFT_1332638 [Mycena rebaudengoi]|nr:hypothetical protein C8J57DRAFT_1332638 [Mycena rebaudengoi]